MADANDPSARDEGLCPGCRHVRVQESARGSVFLRCGLADERDDFPRYPPLPVRACAGFALRDASAESEID